MLVFAILAGVVGVVVLVLFCLAGDAVCGLYVPSDRIHCWIQSDREDFSASCAWLCLLFRAPRSLHCQVCPVGIVVDRAESTGSVMRACEVRTSSTVLRGGDGVEIERLTCERRIVDSDDQGASE
jgi:hypothetical protein